MPTLDEVEVAFSQWRANRSSTHERIPENLIEMARALVSEHGVVIVSKRLKIAHRKLSRKKERLKKFLEVSRETMPSSVPQVVVLNLRLSQKKEITVTIPAGNITAISELIKKMSKL